MCGILGSINLPFDNRQLDLISHRGPDGQGILSLEQGSHLITLGHRRLAIVDVSENGSQPMSLSNGNKHIVFNGEIYNHLEIRKNLKNKTYRGWSDTETILNALSELGIKAVEKFNGIFAFAFVDLHDKKLYLVRDPYGVKPLYYCATSSEICFSSELKPLLSLVRAEISGKNLVELLKLRFSPSPDTLFSNIKKVRPGHLLEVDYKKDQLVFRESPYVSRQGSVVDNISFQESIERYGELFECAVKRQLMSDVEVGILLSGGIDSALVAKYAQKHSKSPLKAFTIGFNEEVASDVDEVNKARETAALLGMEHYIAKIDYGDFMEGVRQCVSIVEEPLATTSIVPMYYLARLAGQNVKVVLSGQGADESLGGYGRYQGELYHDMIPSTLAKISKEVASKFGIKNDKLLRGLNALSENDDIERFLKVYEVFGDSEIESLVGSHQSDAGQNIKYVYALLNCFQQSKSVSRMMSLDLRLNLADDLLLYTDKLTMYHSLECRVPMLDHDLVKFIEALPSNYRIRLGKSKIVHKIFAQQTLPKQIVQRKKLGFQSPTNKWFKNGGRLRDILLDRSSKFANLFSLSAVNNVITQHENGYNRERQLFLLLCIFYWMEDFA